MCSIEERSWKKYCPASDLGNAGNYFCLLLLLIICCSCQKDKPAEPLESVWDISARDNGNLGNASDIEVNFSKPSNTNANGLYRIFVLKSGKISVHDINFLESLSGEHYTEVAPGDIYPIQGKFLKQQMVDTDGDQIIEGTAYRAAVISVPENYDLWAPSLEYSEEDLILTQNNLVKPFSSSLEAGAGSLAINDQGTLAMSPYDVLADLIGSSEEESPVYFFNTSASFITPNQSYDLLGGSAYDSRGNLYLANTLAGQILRITPRGLIEALNHSGEELFEPDGVFINAEDEIFVADRKNGAVIKIAPDSTSTLVAKTEPGVRGITGDEAGNLYAIINQEEGWVIKISPDGQTSKFAQIPTFVPPDYLPTFITWVGYLTYHQGNLYVAGTSTHRIYKVDVTGTVTVFAGSGTKLLPTGDARTAHFNRPIGLAFSADSKRLFISGCLDVTPQHVQASKPSRVYQIEII